MSYFVYVCTDNSPRLDSAGSDLDRGILGTLSNLPEPIAECETIDAALAAGHAYISHHPSAFIYVADANSLLREMLLCHPHHEKVDGLQRSLFIAWTCFTFAALSFIATVLSGVGPIGLAVAAGAIGLYLLMNRIGFMNEVESGLLCLILATLIFLLIPAFWQAWDAYQRLSQ